MGVVSLVVVDDWLLPRIAMSDCSLKLTLRWVLSIDPVILALAISLLLLDERIA